MPQRKSGVKALKINKRHHLHNLDIKTDLKKTIKSFRALLESKKTEEATAELKTVYKKLDKAAKRGIIHKNTAARKKSQLSKLLKVQ